MGSLKEHPELYALFSRRESLKKLLTLAVLCLAWLVGFMSRLFSVVRFESIIHEFDPWFNYRATQYMVTHGFYDFYNWFDSTAWYPLGRIVGGTVYPGLMLTSVAIHYILNLLNITVHIREVCVFLAPVFSGLTSVSTYLLTKELWSPGAGLLAAGLISIIPGYISRSVAGSYDNEGIAIFALQFTFFLWVKAVKTGTLLWAVLTAISYLYMVSAWGGYVYIINLIPLHVFVLLLMGRYSAQLYIAYCTFFILGLLLSMQIPFVGFQPLRTSEHMASLGVFLLINAYAGLKWAQSYPTVRQHLRILFYAILLTVVATVFIVILMLTHAGYIAPWTGRFYSLWDTDYATIHIPIISSVSEHQATVWASFLFDLHIVAAAFPAGAWCAVRNINDERVFIVLYAVTAVYFAGVMIRLMLTLTPVACVLSAIALSESLIAFLHQPDPPEPKPKGPIRKISRNAAGRRWDSTVVGGRANGDFAARSRTSSAASTSDQDNVTGSGKQGIGTGSGTVGNGPSAANDIEPITVHRPEKDVYYKVAKVKTPSEEEDESSKSKKRSFHSLFGSLMKLIAFFVGTLIFIYYSMHCNWVTSNAYSSPSVVIDQYRHDGTTELLDDYREAYYWLRKNTKEDAKIMSWWDYGYQIAGMAARTTLVDNNTWNNSHIALVGKAMASNETEAYKIMRALDVDYVLVIFGGASAYSGDDINKFLWMVRIAAGEHPNHIRENDYFSADGNYRIDSEASSTMKNCLMYKLSYYRFGQFQIHPDIPAGYDLARESEVGVKSIRLRHLEEAFTSENWIVRIYRVLKPKNRPAILPGERRIKLKKRSSTSKSKKGGKGKMTSKTRSFIKGKQPQRS